MEPSLSRSVRQARHISAIGAQCWHKLVPPVHNGSDFFGREATRWHNKVASALSAAAVPLPVGPTGGNHGDRYKFGFF